MRSRGIDPDIYAKAEELAQSWSEDSPTRPPVGEPEVTELATALQRAYEDWATDMDGRCDALGWESK